jgi:hypothetical protein
MSDPEVVTDEAREYFEYVDDLVTEMHELFVKHEALVEEYSRAMGYLQQRDWRQGYVQWVDSGGSVESMNDDGSAN